MLGQERKRGGRAPVFAIDVIHVAVGILIVILAVLAFLNPEDNMILFPVIFLLAGILDLVNGFDHIRNGRGQKKKKFLGIVLIAVGFVLLLLSVVSTVTIWWR